MKTFMHWNIETKLKYKIKEIQNYIDLETTLKCRVVVLLNMVPMRSIKLVLATSPQKKKRNSFKRKWSILLRLIQTQDIKH